MAIKLASMFIEIGAKAGKLTAELKKGRKSTKAWARDTVKATERAKKSFLAVTAAATTYQVGAALLYSSTAASVAQQAKLAGRLSTTATQLKILGIAARSAGVDQEGVNDTLADFTERLGEARIDGGEPAEALDLLGLSAERLAKLDPADALRQVLEAMESLPDAGVRAATGAKLFGDEGIKITGLLSEEFEKAEKKIKALGGGLSDLEVAQIKQATASVADLSLVGEAAREKFTAKLAPAVNEVAKQLFQTATQSGQLEGVLDQLVLSALGGVSSIASVSGALIRFIDGREEIAAGGILGYMLYGKKGFAVLSGVALASGVVKDLTDQVALHFSDSATELQKVTAQIDTMEEKLKLLETPGLGSFLSTEQGRDAYRAEIELLKERQIALAGIGNVRVSALDETASLAGAAADGLELLSATLDEVITQYGELDRSPVELASVGVIDKNSESVDFAANDPVAPGYDDAPMELIRTRLEEENDLKAQLRAEYFANALAEEQQFQNTWTVFQDSGSKDRLKILVNETSGALATLAQHSRTMFELNKAVGLANATVYIATGITRAFSELPFPAALGASVKIGLTGLAQIQTITKAKYGKGDVTSPGAGGATLPTADVSSPNSNVAANDPSISDNLRSQNTGGGLVAVFTSPGASEEQRADEYAQAMQIAQDNDLLVPNSDGGLTYTGTGGSSYTPPAWERSA